MAVGKASDFIVYDEESFAGGQMEATASSEINLFNGASNNAIVLENRFIRGDYEKESFLDSVASAISRRDVTSTSAQTATAMTQDEIVGVKIHRKFKVIEQTRDAWMRVGSTPEAMNFALGRFYEQEKLKDMLWTTILCVETAIAGQTNLNNTIGGALTPTALNNTLQKFGDAQGQVIFWLLHSTPWFDYRNQGISDKVDSIYSGLLNAYTMPGLARPFGVVDATALADGSGSTQTYNILGLVAGAAVCTQSEPDEILFERVSGGENITYRFQAEYAINVKVKGFKWDVTNGGATPTDATLGTTTNWDKAFTEDKHLAGVRAVATSTLD